MDAALDDLIHAINITAQKTAATEVQKLSVELTPYIPLFLSDDTHAIRKEWVNYTFVPGGIFTSMNRLTMINIYKAAPEVLPPTIVVLSPANATYDTTSVSLIFTVDESTSWIGYSLDGAANVTITGNTTVTGLAHGSHRIVVYANDTQGNMGVSNTVYFVIVTTPTPPVVIILSPGNTTYTSTSVDLRLSISEATSWIRYSLDGAANVTITGTSATLTGLSIGSHWLRAYANDTTGLIGSSSTIYFTIAEAPAPGIDWTLIIAVAVIFIVVGAAAVYLIMRRK